MSLELPKPIAAYLAAVNAKDVEMLSLCFAEEAVVHDEGREYRGLDAIKSWGEETQRKYEYAMEALDTAVGANSVRVRAKLTGTLVSRSAHANFAVVLLRQIIHSMPSG